MKLQLIMTEPPIVVSDEKVNKSDFWYDHKNNEYGESLFENGIPSEWGKISKVIAGLHKLPSIDFSLISEEDYDKIEYDYDELGILILEDGYRAFEKQHGYRPNKGNDHLYYSSHEINEKDNSVTLWYGEQTKHDCPYSTSIELPLKDSSYPKKKISNKEFSLENIKKAIDLAHAACRRDVPFSEDLQHQIIQSISQPRIYDIKVEMEQKKFKTGIEDNGTEEECYESPAPKVTNNSIKITEIL